MARPTSDEGNARAAVPGTSLKAAVRAGRFVALFLGDGTIQRPVVRRKNDQRVVGELHTIDRCQHPPDVLVRPKDLVFAPGHARLALESFRDLDSAVNCVERQIDKERSIRVLLSVRLDECDRFVDVDIVDLVTSSGWVSHQATLVRFRIPEDSVVLDEERHTTRVRGCAKVRVKTNVDRTVLEWLGVVDALAHTDRRLRVAGVPMCAPLHRVAFYRCPIEAEVPLAESRGTIALRFEIGRDGNSAFLDQRRCIIGQHLFLEIRTPGIAPSE